MPPISVEVASLAQTDILHLSSCSAYLWPTEFGGGAYGYTLEALRRKALKLKRPDTA